MTTLADFELDAVPEQLDDDGYMPDSASKAAPPSVTALKLDQWSMRQGARLLADPEWTQATGLPVTPEGQTPDESMQAAAADIRAAAYEPDPQLAETCADPLRSQFVKELLQTPDWLGLRASTVYDDASADLASACGAKQYMALVKAQAEAEKNGKEFDPEMQAIKSASDATRQARQEVNDYQDACQACGMGGGQNGKLDPKNAAAMFKRLKGNAQLKRIADLAGRYRRLAQAQQRRKCLHGQDDMVGIVQDGDLGRLVPSELAQLADEDTELLAMRRIVERQAMCREYRGVENVARGPIVVLIDESGSMSGEPLANAKALALALAWIARNQHRWCALATFSSGPESCAIALPPGKWDEARLLDWLEHFDCGGTDCDVLCETLPGKLWGEFEQTGLVRGKTDIFCITDGIFDVPTKTARKFNAWKAAEQAKLTTLIIGCRQAAGDLATISDDVRLLPVLDIEQEAVVEVLSV